MSRRPKKLPPSDASGMDPLTPHADPRPRDPEKPTPTLAESAPEQVTVTFFQNGQGVKRCRAAIDRIHDDGSIDAHAIDGGNQRFERAAPASDNPTRLPRWEGIQVDQGEEAGVAMTGETTPPGPEIDPGSPSSP